MRNRRWNLETIHPLLLRGLGRLSAFLVLCLAACARMGSPDGGWYDDTPPSVVGSSPKDRGVDVKARKVTINFSEFIKVEDVQNKVIVSPPQLEMPEIKATGKRIVVELKDTLKQNTTYTIDFSDAISDNNEGNPMGNYTFTFSTGSEIDTLQVSGYALNAENLEPIKGILVGLYEVPSSSVGANVADSLSLSTEKDSLKLQIVNGLGAQEDSLGATEVADSFFYKRPMIRVSRTNGSGQFTIKGVAPGNYVVYALQDADGDFVYGQKSEMIGFSHDVISPTWKPDTRQDTVWTDSLHISDILRIGYTHFLPDDVTLLCFTAPQTDRYLLKVERKDPEKLGFFFSYGHDSLPRLRGLNFPSDSAFVIEPSPKRDTVYYWLRDTALVNQDTLRMEVAYMMTDSTGLLIEKTDTIEALPKIPYAKRLKTRLKELEDWQKKEEKKKKRGEPYDSVMPLPDLKPKLSVMGAMAPNQNVTLEVPQPLAVCDTAAFHLYMKIDTLWYEAPFRFEQTGTRTYRFISDWKEGSEYSLEIDTLAFRDIYGLVSKPITQGIKVKTVDEFSSLVVSVSGAGADTAQVIVQLLNSDKPIRQTVAVDGTAEFYYLPPGKYYLRAFIDLNRNGIWDTGDYAQDLQAEPVYYYPEEIECKVKWDVTRDWQLEAVPRYRQKPLAITKQKPDKEKQLRNRNAKRAADKGIKYMQGKGVNVK